MDGTPRAAFPRRLASRISSDRISYEEGRSDAYPSRPCLLLLLSTSEPRFSGFESRLAQVGPSIQTDGVPVEFNGGSIFRGSNLAAGAYPAGGTTYQPNGAASTRALEEGTELCVFSLLFFRNKRKLTRFVRRSLRSR